MEFHFCQHAMKCAADNKSLASGGCGAISAEHEKRPDHI